MARYEQYHVFSIPQHLLDNLVPRNIGNQHATVPNESSRPATPSLPSAATSATSGARACNICLGVAFAGVDEQRAHFRSDWHRYNVKIRMSGGIAVSETQFTQLVDGMQFGAFSRSSSLLDFLTGLEDSLSGSASTSSGSDESEDDTVSALVHKTKRLRTKRDGVEDEDESINRNLPNAPVVWFHSPPSTQLGVYKALFPAELITHRGDDAGQLYVNELKEMQKGGGEEGRKWALFMTAGGHFAGAIVRVSSPEGEEDTGVTKKGKQKKQKPDTEILKHKTFHRYTSKSYVSCGDIAILTTLYIARRKQGGSQSLNDNAKSKAVSAGAMLRRYGEQALRDVSCKLPLTYGLADLPVITRIFAVY
jgi:hypothetical protein